MNWLETAQKELDAQGLAGWLLYDFRGSNPIAKRFIGLDNSFLTRRVFLYVPVSGRATLLVSSIEVASLPDLPYDVKSYSSRQDLETHLSMLLPRAKVALEYSPMNNIPYVSYVDAGTLELIRSLGVEPVSSADILQSFSAWTQEQLKAHVEAVQHVLAAKDMAFEYISLRTQVKARVRETDVQRVMTDYFDAHGLHYDHPPIVAFGAHAADPHYSPNLGTDSELKVGDAVLMDVWAKLPHDEAPYADVTWMGCYEAPSEALLEVFEIVRDARDLAVKAIQDAYSQGRYPEGREIDRITRDYIASKGYADAFTHRTGHSLGHRHTHGDAAHLDDFETCDTRTLRPGLALTVEPGIYLKDFGVRSEINLVLNEKGPRLTTAAQQELIILPLPKDK